MALFQRTERFPNDRPERLARIIGFHGMPRRKRGCQQIANLNGSVACVYFAEDFAEQRNGLSLALRLLFVQDDTRLILARTGCNFSLM